MLAGRPRYQVAVPDAVLAIAAGLPARAVWENERGVVTFEIGHPAARFVKWIPTASDTDVDGEVARLVWAGVFTPVPRLIGTGRDPLGSWIATEPLPGENAVSERWLRDTPTAVTAIGRGLRALHEALPAETCPFSWSLENRRADAQRRATTGALDPGRWHPMHQSFSIPEALDLLDGAPPVDRLVVCHGDACAPNTILTDDGHWSGHVDLGAMGLADRWADLAVATWSCDWNYGADYQDLLLDAYGVTPDRERTRYYRLLWDLGP